MRLTVFYDYTCEYSFRVWRWLDSLGDVAWRTFSLREMNREVGTPSLFADPEVSSISVLALALGHVAREADFPRYHRAVFEAMHAEHRKVGREDLLRIAGAAGVDAAAFELDRARWAGAVADEHARAIEEWGVFGTPTIVVEGGGAVFLRLSDPPPPDRAGALLDAVRAVAVGHPEVLEAKRPVPVPSG